MSLRVTRRLGCTEEEINPANSGEIHAMGLHWGMLSLKTKYATEKQIGYPACEVHVLL